MYCLHLKKKHSKVNIIRLLIPILILLMIGLYFYYIMIFRGEYEPKTDSTVTSTEAVLYDTEEQLSILKNFDEMYEAMSGNAAEENYGMIAIPGLESTRTLTSNNSGEVSICTSMTPQGMCTTEDYLLVSAYCHTHEHNSVVYVIDKHTGKFIKEIVLKDKNHVGGLAFDTKHHMIWVSTSHDRRAAASAFSLKNLKSYDLEKTKVPIAYTHDYDLYTLEKDSFMTYSEGYLYIGHFSLDESSVVQKFKIGTNGGLKTESGASLGLDKEIAIPEDVKQIPKQVQGFAIYKDKVILTQSYGVKPSNLLVHNYSDIMYQTGTKYTINKINMPQKLEQIYIDGNDLYVLFESAAYAYSAQPLPKVDRICKLELNEILKVDIDDIESEKDTIPDSGKNIWKQRLEAQAAPRLQVEYLLEELQIIKENGPMGKIQELAAGTVISETRLAVEDIDSLFYAEPISDEVFARMYGKSYKEYCTIPREELRYVRVLHVGFDGKTYIGELVVNEIIAEKTVDIFRELYKISYPIEKIRLIDDYDADDGASMADNNASAFNFRFISYTTNLSNHASGLAIDINPLYNPYVKMVDDWLSIEPANGADYVDRDKDFPYKIDHDDPCFQIFTAHGFSWGGDWTNRKDYQHFEYIVEE